MYFCVRTDFVFFWEFVVWSLVCRVNRKHIKVCFSPYVIRCTWLGSKYELTNWLQAVWLLGYRVFTGSMTAWLQGFYRQYDCLVTGFLQAVWLLGYRVFTGSTTVWLQGFYRQYDRLVTGFLQTVRPLGYRVFTDSMMGLLQGPYQKWSRTKRRPRQQVYSATSCSRHSRLPPAGSPPAARPPPLPSPHPSTLCRKNHG